MNLHDLALHRRRLADLRIVDRTLAEQFMAVPDYVRDEIRRLADLIVPIDMKCMICSATVTHHVKVDSTGYPHAAVCGNCANCDDALIA